jgi:hypothetical protein
MDRDRTSVDAPKTDSDQDNSSTGHSNDKIYSLYQKIRMFQECELTKYDHKFLSLATYDTFHAFVVGK